jgi:uncharacterized membrane protein HdeD (DUF308 family)
MTQPTSSSQVSDHRGRWKWFLALGVVLLLLGIAGVSVSGALELTSLLVFGPLLLTASGMQLLTSFFLVKRQERLLGYAAAAVELLFGFAIMLHPIHRVVGLLAVVAIFLIVGGLARLARVLAEQSRARAWIIMTGAIALLLGISVWIGAPVDKLWFVGLCIAVDFICHGVSWLGFALVERKAHQEPVSPDAQVGLS